MCIPYYYDSRFGCKFIKIRISAPVFVVILSRCPRTVVGLSRGASNVFPTSAANVNSSLVFCLFTEAIAARNVTDLRALAWVELGRELEESCDSLIMTEIQVAIG